MVLAERGEQLAEMDRLVAGCAAGQGAVALLDGTAGSGRSGLLRAAVRRAAESGFLVLTARCLPGERAFPLGVVHQLFHHAALPERERERVAALLDEAVRHSAPVSHGVLRFLRDLAGDKPVLVGIDDLHQADEASLHCLLHLVRGLRAARVLVVLTEHPAMHAELLGQPHCHRITCTPLSERGVCEMLAEHPELSLRRTDFFAISGGNPELVRALIDDHRAAARTGPGPAYRGVLLKRLRRCEPAVGRVAVVLALLDGTESPMLLGKLAAVTDATAARAMGVLTAAGVLDQGRFRHPAARAAILDQLPAQDRRRLQRRVAKLLHDHDASATEIDRCLAGAAPAVPVVQVEAGAAVEDGEDADNVEDTATLAKLARVEWRINPDSAARHLTALTAALRAGRLDLRDGIEVIKQLLWLGRIDEAADCLDLVRADFGDTAGFASGEAWLRCLCPHVVHRAPGAGIALRSSGASDPRTLFGALARGHHGDAAAGAEQILRDTGPWHSTGESALLALLILVCADRLDIAARWSDRMLADIGGLPVPTWQAVLFSARAEIAVRRGDFPTALEHARTALNRLTPAEWGVGIGFPLGTLIMAATRMGRYDLAAGYLGHPVPAAMSQTVIGLHYRHACGHFSLTANRYDAALVDFLECGELMRGWGMDVAGLVPWRLSAAEAWIRRGNRDDARQLINEQLVCSGADRTRIRGVSLRLLAAVSEPERRPRLLGEAVRILEERDDRFELVRALSDLGIAYRALAQHGNAGPVVHRAWRVAKQCEAASLYQDLLREHTTVDAPPPTVASAAIGSLSAAQRRVAVLAALGHKNWEIAERLVVTTSTVEQHLTKVYRKLNITNRADLAVGLRASPAKAL